MNIRGATIRLSKHVWLLHSRGMETFTEVTIPVPWGHMAGKWWGNTQVQPALGIHGWQDNAGTFDNLAPLLDLESFLALDLPGHGKSSPLPLGMSYHFIDSASFIRRAVYYCNLKKPILIGHSMGSAMCFFYSILYPDEVDKFVSIDCVRTHAIEVYQDGWKPNLPEMREYMEKVVAPGDRNPYFHAYDDLLHRYYEGLLRTASLESCAVLLKRGARPSPHDAGKFQFTRDHRLKELWLGPMTVDFILTFSPSIKTNVLSIRCKQGYLRGDKAKKIYLDSLRLIDNCEFHEVDGRHYLHLDQPERLAPLINKFLKRNCRPTEVASSL